MPPYNCIIIGSGKRVRETALPAFARVENAFRVARVFARTEKTLDANGRAYAVSNLARATAAELADVNFVYVAVGKKSVPEVLQTLLRLGLARATLLVDTPVLLLKDFRYIKLFGDFAGVSVAEDCIALPWYDLIFMIEKRGDIGAIRSVEFDRSAYAYHAFAMAKTVLSAARVSRARRVRIDGGRARRDITFNNGSAAIVREPRDYAAGSFTIRGVKGCITEKDMNEPNAYKIEPVLAGGDCSGFRALDLITHLDDAEIQLMRGGDPGAGVTARMDAMKRVGFLRLLRRIGAGGSAYPLLDGLEDTTVDWFLEKTGHYRSTPITNIRRAPARAFFTIISSLARPKLK
ncbi:MAG: hypothetical protein HY286_00185 [Planctomycetes bacterium]|nr:hypothetical protein [Planctomycetota bacterium]